MTSRFPACFRIGLAVFFTIAAGNSSAVATAPATNLVIGTSRWVMFVPDETHANCSADATVATRSGQVGIRLHSDQLARYGVRPQGRPIRVRAGERFRVSVWVKLEDDARVEADTPGVVLRATFFSGPDVDFSGGHLFVGASGVSPGSPNGLAVPRLADSAGLILQLTNLAERIPANAIVVTTGTTPLVELAAPLEHVFGRTVVVLNWASRTPEQREALRHQFEVWRAQGRPLWALTSTSYLPLGIPVSEVRDTHLSGEIRASELAGSLERPPQGQIVRQWRFVLRQFEIVGVDTSAGNASPRRSVGKGI